LPTVDWPSLGAGVGARPTSRSLGRALVFAAAVLAVLMPFSARRAAAQGVLLQIRPRLGDTLRMRLDQTAEMSGTTRIGNADSTMTVSTAMHVLTHAVVQRSDAASTTLLSVTDSVSLAVTGSRAASPDAMAAAARKLEGRQAVLRLSPDGSAEVVGGDRDLPPSLGALLAAMPASLPRTPVSVGESWVREMAIPGADGARDAASGGTLRATFHLDSVARDDVAFISVRARRERHAGRREAEHARHRAGRAARRPAAGVGHALADDVHGHLGDDAALRLHRLAGPRAHAARATTALRRGALIAPKYSEPDAGSATKSPDTDCAGFRGCRRRTSHDPPRQIDPCNPRNPCRAVPKAAASRFAGRGVYLTAVPRSRGAAPSRPRMRLVHLSDLHLGFRQYQRLTPAGINQREADVAAAFRRAVETTIAIDPQLVVIAGDVFHSVRPTNTSILDAFMQFSRLTRELPNARVVMVAGNHDTPRSSETGCILRLFRSAGVDVVDAAPQRLAYPELELSVLAVPDDLTAQQAVLAPDPAAKYNVLLLHGEVEGMLPKWATQGDRASVEVSREHLGANRWDYVALGHYHVYREIEPNAYYSGSVEYTSANPWGEMLEQQQGGIAGKGLIERDLATGEHRFHRIVGQRDLVDLPAILARGMTAADLDTAVRERVEAVPGGIDDKVVRLVVRDVPRHVAREMDHKALREFKRRAAGARCTSTSTRGGRSSCGSAPAARRCADRRSPTPSARSSPSARSTPTSIARRWSSWVSATCARPTRLARRRSR
jgi:DNA repair protein SbcD/Mre11